MYMHREAMYDNYWMIDWSIVVTNWLVALEVNHKD